MELITISDLKSRLSITKNIPDNMNNSFIEGANSIINKGRVSDIKRMIELAVNENSSNIPLYTILNLYEALLENNGSLSDIEKMGNLIAEKSVFKVRDAKQTNSLLKRRMGRAKSKLKSSSLKKSFDSMKDKYKIKHECLIKHYENMIEKSIICENSDRVLKNYNEISKRFNLDKLFIENTRINGVSDTIIELCNRIDTYCMDSDVKFNTVIETAWYGFESNNINYNKSEVLKESIEYFLFKEDGVDACKSILESTMFYDKDEDMGDIDIITEEEPEEEIKNESIINTSIDSYLNINNTKPIQESNDFNELFRKFKETELGKDDHPENKLKSLVNKLYKKDVHSITDGTPDLLSWIRKFFILGVAAVPQIGGVLMISGFIADKFIQMSVDRKEVLKMSKCFSNEIKASKKKLDTLTDKEDIDRMNKYIDSLKKAKDEIDLYHNNLLTDDEQNEKYDNMEYDDDDFDDFDFDDDDWLNEMTKLETNIEEYYSFIKENDISELDMYHLVKCENVSNEDISNISKLSCVYPDIFHKDMIIKGIQESINDIRSGNIEFSNTINKSLRLSSLSSSYDYINNHNYNEIQIITMSDVQYQIENIYEAYTTIHMIIKNCNETNSIMEASITNTLKMASMKLKRLTTKMSDKDKSISRSVDVGLNNLTKSVEKSLTNDNRESIIKGSILPSASKMIKLALINAGLIAVNQWPLAIIGTLGYLGTSAKFKSKERQMIIDEIDIELKMCQKYIDIAESKNDMKALKDLLTIQKDLERQSQRIKYKMKTQ